MGGSSRSRWLGWCIQDGLWLQFFFVLSGYVLSHRGLKLARDGDLVKLMDSLSSSVFRRWIRLCVPVITSTYIGFLLTRFSMYQDLPTGWQHKTPLNSNTDNAARPKPIISAIPLPIPPPPMTFNKELWGKIIYTLTNYLQANVHSLVH